jgi:hypothetical protein
MADRNRIFALAAIALPLWLLATSGLARAATITVNTLDGGSETVPGPCSLTDAVAAANVGGTVNNCVAGSGTNTIIFSVTGTINLAATLEVETIGFLAINGPSAGGITLSGPAGSSIVSGDLLSMITLTNLTLTNSTGAIFTKGRSLTIENCTFFNNSGTLGAAVLAASGTVTITNSTFVDNVATGFGGAINNFNGATLLLTNDTFVGNQALGGGAVFTNIGTTDIKGSIFADSTGGNCGTGGSGVANDEGYNISDDDSCGFSGTSVNNSTTLHLDPAGLQNNGGPTKTIALEENSEAVDFIPVANCTDQSLPTPQPLTTDQRGFPRPDPGNPDFCDAGAFELQTTPIVISATGERLQIVHASTPSGDQLNTSFTFTENATPTCDAADDPFNGVDVSLRTGSCADLGPSAVGLFLNSWVVHTVNHQTYGTEGLVELPAILSARMVELPTPAAPACGEWTINLEFTGLDLAFLGDGPFALIVSNPDGDQGCLDVTNAIVGNQIIPPTRTVRRGVRR